VIAKIATAVVLQKILESRSRSEGGDVVSRSPQTPAMERQDNENFNCANVQYLLLITNGLWC